jgi:hypothetical protein
MLKRLFSTKKARKLTLCDVSDRRSQVSQMLTHQLTCVQHDIVKPFSDEYININKKGVILRVTPFLIPYFLASNDFIKASTSLK